MEDETINTKHEKGILEAIQKHPIFCFNDIFVYYDGCSRSTAYAHGLDKSDNIKEAIYKNRRKGVTSLKAKWLKSENATLQLAVMRMICDPEEHKTLNQNYTVNSFEFDKEKVEIVDFSYKDLADENQ